MSADVAVDIIAQVATIAVPFALVFGISNAIISMFVRVACGGVLEFRG